VANANDFPFQIQSAGKHLSIQPSQIPFFQAKGEKNWSEIDKKNVKTLKERGRWDEQVGDRCTEVVLIGVDLDKKVLTKKLTEACLTKEEFSAGPTAWKKHEDAFFEGRIKTWHDFKEFKRYMEMLQALKEIEVPE